MKAYIAYITMSTKCSEGKKDVRIGFFIRCQVIIQRLHLITSNQRYQKQKGITHSHSQSLHSDTNSMQPKE